MNETLRDPSSTTVTSERSADIARALTLRQRAVEANAGLRRRLLLGFIAQGLTSTATTAQQLVLVPIFLIFWGNSTYSGWLILVAAADCVRLMEFGFHFHAGNCLRMTWARGDLAEYYRMLRIGLCFYLALLVFGALLIVVSTAFVDWPRALGASSASDSSATLTLLLLCGSTLLLLPRNLLVAIYEARGDFSRGEFLIAFHVLVLTSSSAIALWFGANPLEIAGIYVMAALLIGCGAILFDQKRRYGHLGLGLAVPRLDDARELARNARLYAVPTFSELVLTRAPILLLGMLASIPEAVIVFSISRTFTGVARQIAPQLARVSGIEMARQHAQQDDEGSTHLYLNTGRVIGGVVGLLSGITLAISRNFIVLWTHDFRLFDPFVISLFVIVVFTTAPFQAAIAGFRYISRPRPLALAAIIQTTISIILCLILVPLADARGATVAVGIGEFVATTCYISTAGSRQFQVGTWQFVKAAYSIGTVMCVISYLVVSIVELYVPVRSVLDLAVVVMSSLLVLSGPSFFLLLDRDQRRWLLISGRTAVSRR